MSSSQKGIPSSVVKGMKNWITHNSSTSNYVWDVLDWASLLQKSCTPTMAKDVFYSNEQGLETFWKLIFSRLYVLSTSYKKIENKHDVVHMIDEDLHLLPL